jgi:hypothetical protein
VPRAASSRRRRSKSRSCSNLSAGPGRPSRKRRSSVPLQSNYQVWCWRANGHHLPAREVARASQAGLRSDNPRDSKGNSLTCRLHPVELQPSAMSDAGLAFAHIRRAAPAAWRVVLEAEAHGRAVQFCLSVLVVRNLRLAQGQAWQCRPTRACLREIPRSVRSPCLVLQPSSDSRQNSRQHCPVH